MARYRYDGFPFMYKTEYTEETDEIRVEFTGEKSVKVFLPRSFPEDDIRVLLTALSPMIVENLCIIRDLMEFNRGMFSLSRRLSIEQGYRRRLSDPWLTVPVCMEDAEIIIGRERRIRPSFLRTEQKGLFSFGNGQESTDCNPGEKTGEGESDIIRAEEILKEISEKYSLRTAKERIDEVLEEERAETERKAAKNAASGVTDGTGFTVHGGITDIGNESISFTIEYNTKYKNIGLEVREGPELVVTAPIGADKERISDALITNREWICEKYILSKYAGIESRTNNSVIYEGVIYDYTVKYWKNPGTVGVHLTEDGQIEAYAPLYTKPEVIEAMVLKDIPEIHEVLKESGKVPVENKFPDIIPEFNSHSRTLNGGTFRISGREFPFTVRYGRQYRVVSVEIKEGPELVVTSPYGVDKGEIYETLEINREWICDNYLLVEKAGLKGRTEHSLTYKGHTYNYTVRYLKRSKNVKINLKEDGTINVSAPLHTEVKEIERIVGESARELHEKIRGIKRTIPGDGTGVSKPEKGGDKPTKKKGMQGGTFRVSGRKVPFTVEYSKRRRKVGVELRDGPKLVVTAPYGASEKEIYSVLKLHRQWISENYSLVEKAGINSKTEHTVTYKGETYSYTIKYLKRAKNFRIKVTEDDTVEVTVPATATPEQAEKMVQDNAAFIHKTLTSKERKTTKKIEFCDGASLYIKGEEVTIRAVQSHVRSEPELNSGTLKVTVPHDTDEQDAYIEWEIKNFMQGLTLKEVNKHLPKYSDMLNISVPGIDVKYYKTSWGKCFPAKNLVVFNERLAMIPGELTEYIVAHELCHFHHPNHGKGFYSSLRKVMPDSDEKKQEMKNYRIDMIKRD